MFEYNKNYDIKHFTFDDKYNGNLIISFQDENQYIGENALFLFHNTCNLFILELIKITNLNKLPIYLETIENYFRSLIYNLIKSKKIINLINYRIFLYLPFNYHINDFQFIQNTLLRIDDISFKTPYYQFIKNIYF